MIAARSGGLIQGKMRLGPFGDWDCKKLENEV